MKEKEVQSKLGKKLKELRKKRNKSRMQIAKIIGVSKRKYRKIEKGRANFYLEQGMTLAKYYQISLDEFAKD